MTPRESFQKGPHGEGWNKIVHSQAWEDAKNAALLTMVNLNHAPTAALSDNDKAAIKTHELNGALFFIRQIENLTSIPPAATQRNAGKLETIG
jgi:hypothetical protein